MLTVLTEMCTYPNADEENDVISQDFIPVVLNGIHSATANRERYSVMITGKEGYMASDIW